MGIKQDARDWTIKEQIVDDKPSGLTLQFEVVPDSTARYRLRIYGDLPFGNREILFDVDGEEAGSGTSVTGLCRASWLTNVDD
ncbi:MAG: hypothetical protein KGL39_42385 [Patescibacteria group bacterium]|nr:hypothetical protein [Patescibacteria group bacterium]